MKESHLLDQEKSMLHRGDFHHKSSESKTVAHGLAPPGDALSVVPDAVEREIFSQNQSSVVRHCSSPRQKLKLLAFNLRLTKAKHLRLRNRTKTSLISIF